MTKKRESADDDMEKINELYHETQRQSRVLEEILMCIKGDESLNIEGVIPAQRRIQEEMMVTEKILTSKIDTLTITITQINDWKNAITIYIGIITSKKIWKFLFVLTGLVVITVLSIKYGFLTIWQYIKNFIM